MTDDLKDIAIRRIMEAPDEELEELLFRLEQYENESIFFMHVCQTLI